MVHSGHVHQSVTSPGLLGSIQSPQTGCFEEGVEPAEPWVGEKGSGECWAGCGHCCECVIPSRRFAGGKDPAWEEEGSAPLGTVLQRGPSHAGPSIPSAPGWPRLVPGTGQAPEPAETELKHGCHLPTTPSPPRHLSGLSGCCGCFGCCGRSPGCPDNLVHPWDSSEGTMPWHSPMPALAKILHVLDQRCGSRVWAPPAEGHQSCGLRHEGLQRGQLQPQPSKAQRSEARSAPGRASPPLQSLLPAL